MDLRTYKINECIALIYYMEASQDATSALFNGKNYELGVNQKVVTSDVLGYKGENSICIQNFIKVFFRIHSVFAND